MAAFNFTTLDDRNFALNSRAYPSIYMARQFDNDPGFIEIVEKDNQLSHLIERERISNISIDGKSNWTSAEELQVALNSQLKIGGFKSPGSGGGSGSGSASDVTVNQSGFETISGPNVQAALGSIDSKLTEGIGVMSIQQGDGIAIDNTDPANPKISATSGGGNNSVIYDENGNILAGETLLGQFSDGVETWGNQATDTAIASFGRPEVINPAEGIKQEILNNNLLPWANNADFKDPSPRGWRIPTNDEILALDAAGRGAWTKLNGVNGRYIGGDGSVFFPAAGAYDIYSGSVVGQAEWAQYWSATPQDIASALGIVFSQNSYYRSNSDAYAIGYSLRCVRDVITTDFTPCPAGEFQLGNIVWAKSNLSGTGVFAENAEDYGAYFQWGQNTAIGADGQPLSIRHKIAYLSDMPIIPPQSRRDITSMFTPSIPLEDFAVEMAEFGGKKPRVRVWAQANESSGTDDLTIAVSGGFGAYYRHFDERAIILPGKELVDDGQGGTKWATGNYDVTITEETDQANSVITIPNQVRNVDFSYFLGKTTAPRASYYTDAMTGITNPFELANSPLAGFYPNGAGGPININGNAVRYVGDLVFGTSYNTITDIPAEDPDYGFLNRVGYGTGMLDISGLKNVTSYGDHAFESLRFRALQIRDLDASIIQFIGTDVFYGSGGQIQELWANTQSSADAFKAKFPPFTYVRVIINP